MLSKKLLARDIENLTDARYFAAWFVDWMSFDFNQASVSPTLIMKHQAIIDWVDGPKIMGEFSGLESEEYILDVVQQCGLDGIILGAFAEKSTIEALQHLTIFQLYNAESIDWSNEHIDSYIIHTDQINEGIPAELQEKLIVEINSKDLDKSDLDKFEMLSVRGGTEDQIGLKSYEDLDLIYDHLISED